MKRNTSSQLERSRTEFPGPRNSGRPRRLHRVATMADVIPVKDGYDWLQVIKRVEGTVNPAR